MAIILGIDKFMSECRALTNLVGNGVACIVVIRLGRRARPRQAARRPHPPRRPVGPGDRGYNGLTRVQRGLALALGAALSQPCCALADGGRETIVFIRHGEKPEAGLGQLSCQGLNRALALPAVLKAKFGMPAAMFAPDPAARKDDGGRPYSYVRPLATIEPSAVAFGLPVDTSFGFRDVDKLRLALEQPGFHGATIVVAWEHHLIDLLAQTLVTAHGGQADDVLKWHSDDFDGIDVVAIDWSVAPPRATFSRDHQGLNGLPETCPK